MSESLKINLSPGQVAIILMEAEDTASRRGWVFKRGQAPDFYGHPSKTCERCTAHGYTLESSLGFPHIIEVRDWHRQIIHAYRQDDKNMPIGFVFCGENCPCPQD